MKNKYLLRILLTIAVLSHISFAQLSGIKTIPGDYATIQAAITALNAQGVGTGGVTFNVASGHTESITTPIQITATGTSSNPIVIQKSGVGTNPIITRTDAGSTSTSIIGGAGDAIIRLNGTDYITFNGIDVKANNQGIEYGYLTHKPSGTDGCQNVTIKNCVVTMTKGTSRFVIGIYIGNGTTSSSNATGVTVTAESGRNKNITINGNTVQNVHAGIYVRGSTNLYDSDIIIGQSGEGNIIQNFGGGSANTTYGVYFIYVNNPTVGFNNINNAGGGGTSHENALYGIFYSTGISGNVVGSNNTINLSNASASSATYFIHNGNTATSEIFSNNTFSSDTISSTGIVYLIFAQNATPSVTVSGNQTTGTINGASGNFYCYNKSASSGTIIENIFDNTFSGITLTGATAFYGIYSNSTPGSTQNIYNNNLYGISGGSGSFTGIYIDAGSNVNIYNNNISEIAVTSNTVNGIIINGGSSANVYIYNNFISHLNATTANSPDAIRAIYLPSNLTNTTIGVYYNTIYLNASSSGTNFGTTGIYQAASSNATATALDMRNNIIINLSTPNGSGRTVVLRRSGTVLGNYSTLSNNNCFYAGTPASNRLIYFDGTNADQTIAAFKTRVAPRETNSFTENVNFINVTTPPYNLHINSAIPTFTESGGAPITSPITITQDFDGDARNVSTPDVGADEFNGYTPNQTPPVITYTPLGGGQQGSSQNLVNVSITDADGVNTTSGTAPRVYYKKSTDANNISGWKWVETSGTGPLFNFTIDYSLLNAGSVSVGDVIQYFVVAQDLFIVPNVAINSGTFNQPAASVNLTSNNFPIGGTINSYIILNPISGTLMVGSGETYTSLTADSPQGLFKKLNESLITGNITVRITSNLTESGAVALNQTYEEANFSITVVPNDASQKIISGNYAGGLIRLNGADNVTFDGRYAGSGRYLTFRNTSTSLSGVFQVISSGTNAGATDNTIRNCNIEGGTKDNNTYGIFAGSSTLGVAGNDNDNLSIIDNIISKAESGIFVIATSSGVNNNLLISGNAVGSEIPGSYVSRYGIVIQQASGASIIQNTVFNIISDVYNTFGIYSHFTTNTTISGNLIHSIRYSGTSPRAGTGIDVNTQSFSSNLSIVNNVIFDISGNGFEGGDDAIKGIRIHNNQGGINIYYNSVNLFGQISRSIASNDRSYSIFIGSGVTDLNIRNNIFANSIENTTGTATAYAIYSESAAAAFTNIDFNDYYASGPEGVLGFLGSNRTNLGQWQSATGKDNSSLNANPLFTLNTDLRPQTGSPVNGAGVSIAGITTDFLGVLRGIPPSIGAYEEAGDFGAPVILYTPLVNTSSTSNRTLSDVSITDATGVNWTTAKPRIYYKKSTDNNVFGGNTSAHNGWKWTEANTTSSPTNFTINYSILYGGSVSQGDVIQYFVAAQDISVPPLVASNPSVGFAGSSVSSITSAPISPNQYSILGNPLSGDYTIGISGMYATLTLAVQDLNNVGVSGPVRFLLIDGTYGTETYPIVIDIAQNQPTSTNTVTIKPNTGVTPTISGASSTQILKILNSFVTIDGSNSAGGTSRDLTIENNTNYGNQNVILIGSKGSTPVTNVEIKNSRIISRNNEVHFTGPAALLIRDEDGTSNGRFNNITIRNNKIMRANYGIYCEAVNIAGNGSGLLITENNLDDAAQPIYHCGIFLYGVDGGIVSKNTIANIEGLYGQNDKGIEISYYSKNCIVEANTIHTITGPELWGAHGIYVTTYLSNANILIRNNVIYNITAGGYIYSGFNLSDNPHGIYLQYSQSGIKIYNNSINLYGNTLNNTAAISTGIALDAGSSADLKNNIIVNNLGLQSTIGYGSVGIYLKTGSVQLEASSNNLIYVNPSGSGVKHTGQIGTTGYSALQDWRTVTGHDKYSYSGNPVFTSNTNLLPVNTDPGCWAVNNKGIPLTSVPTDFTGNTRSTTVANGPVDIGAYEFSTSTTPPLASQSGSLTNNGTTNYNVYNFTAGSLQWGSGGTVPSGINFTYYTGIEPPKPNHPDKAVSKCYWEITSSGGSGYSYNVNFNYDEAQIGNIPESNLRLAKSDNNGVSWNPYLSEGTGTDQYQLNTTTNTITVYGLTTFSLFALTDVSNPLPVELNSFTASVKGRDVILKWETKTEVNSYTFEIERIASNATLMQTWESIGSVKASGNSNSPRQYSFTDRSLNSGNYVYRLKMIDTDGSFDYSPEVESKIDAPREFQLTQNYPNPFNPSTKIDYQLPFESLVTIEIYSLSGERVTTLINQEQAAGYYSIEVNSASLQLASGIYFYRISAHAVDVAKTFTQIKKMVILK